MKINDRTLIIVFWSLFLGSITFVWSGLFVDSLIVPKWIAFGIFGVLLILVNAVRVLANKDAKLIFFPDMQDMLCVISTVLLVLSVAGILQYHGQIGFLANGMTTVSYDNPAGFSATLAVGLPFVLLGMLGKSRFHRNLHIMTFGLLIIAMVLSHSRAGVCSILAVFLFGGLTFVTKRAPLKVGLMIAWIFILVMLFVLKPESASGRMLIWICTLQMIKDKWLFGYGPGGFEANYMDCQAAYLAVRPDSPYAQLADTVQYPFNEYLYVTVNYGIVGLSIVLAFLAYMVYRYLKNKSTERLAALLCIIAASVFAMFSYPSMYPFVWFAVIYGAAILMADMKVTLIRKSAIMKTSATAAIIVCCFVSYKLYKWSEAEIRWKRVAVSQHSDKNILAEYADIYTTLHDDRYFMYNYAYKLYQAEDYVSACKYAKECRNLWADYDVEILLGHISGRLDNCDEAERHYINAEAMCPNRFRPLFYLMKLSEENKDFPKAVRYAEEILCKQIKIPSTEVDQIRREAEKIVGTYRLPQDS